MCMCMTGMYDKHVHRGDTHIRVRGQHYEAFIFSPLPHLHVFQGFNLDFQVSMSNFFFYPQSISLAFLILL